MSDQETRQPQDNNETDTDNGSDSNNGHYSQNSDFIYVSNETLDNTIDIISRNGNGDATSLASIDKKSRRSSGSSYADVRMADFEAKLENERSDVSRLVADAQLDDIHSNYFSDEEMEVRRGSAPLLFEGSSSNSDDETDMKRCSSDASYSKDACILFHAITYLGSATVNAPVSEIELRRTISILRDHTEVSINVILAVGLTPHSDVRLIDPESRTDIASYKISSICFWGKGDSDNREKDCFAFNISHGKDDPTFHCHVFQCSEEDAVGKILQSISQTLKKDKKRKQLAFPSLRGYGLDPNNLSFKYDITLDMWEEDGRGSYQTVARDRNCFKLREGLQRKVVLILDQLSNKRLHVERCFGLLLAAGHDVEDRDMCLLEYIQMDPRPDGRVVLSGHWNPLLDQYKMLNTVTSKDARASITIAADIIFAEVKEPIRIVKESKAKIFPTNEKFWNPTKPRISEIYTLELKENFTEAGEKYFEMLSLLSATALTKQKAEKQTSLSTLWRTKKSEDDDGTPQSNAVEGEVFDDDEPLLSGSGGVDRECSEEELLNWQDIMEKWSTHEARPKQLIQLVRKGIPEQLRGQIWQMLVGLELESELLQNFPQLHQKDSPQEQVILWDVTRTFPAHEYFKDGGGEGQNALYRCSKAYSSYDEEVGYCQGLSFLIAVLLLHMPEEQAFCLLVKIMFDYGQRDLFKDQFENLHMSFFVLERVMEDYMQDLHLHFQAINIEVHMFASQWFLTLFTAKFPLCMVYQIMDILLCEGLDVMYQIALALLKDSKKELLTQDFEGVLKYFRVNLPKKYMNEDNMKQLINTAFSFKISKKRLLKYKQEYQEWKEEMQWKEDPIARFQRENQRLVEENLRLERENDNLAHELVTSQVIMQEQITEAEERINIMTKENEKFKMQLLESEEEIERLKTEEAKIKEMWRHTTQAADEEKDRKDRIIEDYKQILSKMEERSEKYKSDTEQELQLLKNTLKTCTSCVEAYENAGNAGEDNEDEPTNEVASPHKQITSRLLEEDTKLEQIRDLEAELIQTKMALAEEKHKSDDLEMRLHNVTMANEKPWYKKAISSKR